MRSIIKTGVISFVVAVAAAGCQQASTPPATTASC